MSSNIEEDLKEAINITVTLALVGWASRKAFGKSLTPNPSQSGEAFFTFLATMAGCRIVFRWLDEALDEALEKHKKI